MPTANYITASCVISQGIVYRNGMPVFTNSTPDVKDFLGAVYQHLHVNYPKFHKMDRLSKLGWLAAEVVLLNREIPENSEPAQTGVVISNANASLDTDIRYYQSVHAMASPALFVYTLPNIMIGEICIRNHFKGENAFFVSSEFDGPFIRAYVADLLDRHLLKTCLCGWVDIMGSEYKAALYLVEHLPGLINPTDTSHGKVFTDENIENIYSLENG